MGNSTQSLRVRLREAEAKARALADALKARDDQQAMDASGKAFRQGLPVLPPRQGKARANTAAHLWGREPGDVVAVPARLVTWTKYT